MKKKNMVADISPNKILDLVNRLVKRTHNRFRLNFLVGLELVFDLGCPEFQSMMDGFLPG